MGLAPKPNRRSTTQAWLLFAALMTLEAGCRRTGPGGPPAAARADGAVSASAPGTDAPPPRGRSIALLYSSDLLAAYEVCGCPVHPMGGLARRATQVDRARGEADAALVVDAGDLFLPSAARNRGQPTPDPGEIARRVRLLAAAFGRIGTTAVTPGERDLALGLPLLRQLAKATRLALVSANLRGPDGRHLFEADRLVEAAGVKVGIFGVTAPPTPEDAVAWRAAGIDALDPARSAREAVASLRARGAAIVVALLHLPSAPATRALLASVPGIDWAVAGHAGMRLETPEKVGGGWLLAAMAEGKELGRLDLHVVGGSLAFADRGERAELETILADHRRQLTDYDKRLGETDPASLREYYQGRRRDIDAAIARETALLARLPRTVTGSWFDNRLLPLDATTPDQTGVALLVDAYNRESVRRAAAGKPVGVGTDRPATASASPAPSTPGAAPDYVGTPACGRCHAPALAFWRTTKHAHALAALARVGRDHDPSCVGCHVTGYLQPGGWRVDAPTAARTPLDNVGCEVCHGPGRAHLAAPDKDKKTSTTRQVAPSVCLGCHTADITNGELDVRRFTAAILGPGHGKPTPALAPGPRPPL